MTLSWDEISKLVLGTLSEAERVSCVVYLDERILPQDTVIEIDGQQVRLPWLGAIAFVDLEPRVNWAHASRYLLINVETGEIQSIESGFPPFLRGAPDTLRVIWKGEDVPQWTVAV